MIKYVCPTNPLRAWIYKTVQNPNFELTILGLIGINVVFMMLYHHDMPSKLETTLYWVNIFFIILFALEFIIKIIALGPKMYFSEKWNRFDFIVVFLSLVFLGWNTGFVSATLLRVLRIARLFRLVKVSKGLKKLFYTMITSLPSLVDVGTLLLLLLFVYGVAGM